LPVLKILIDECLDRRLAKEITHAHVKTVPDMGWAGLKNGKLLEKAQIHFDIFLTSDQNLSFQQNLQNYNIIVIVLCSSRNQLEDLKKLVPSLLKVLSKPMSKQLIHIR
jgi:hypothetical protein